MHTLLVDTYNVKGDYIAKRYPESFGKDHPLDSRISDMLKTSGLTPTKEMITSLRFPLVTALTKTQFEMKEFRDKNLDTIFDTVFSDYGMDLRRTSLGEKSLGEILMDLNSQNLDENIKLSSEIENMMNDRMIVRKAELEKHKEFLQGNARQIAQMDRLFSDMTTQLHAQKSMERIQEVEFVRTEETTVKSEIEKLEEDIVAKEKEKKDVTQEKTDLSMLKEVEQSNKDSVITKDYK